jgi:hypothetical protein
MNNNNSDSNNGANSLGGQEEQRSIVRHDSFIPSSEASLALLHIHTSNNTVIATKFIRD